MNIFYSSTDLITLQKIMNRELKKVKKWSDANQLVLNIGKTNYVIFYSPQKKITEQIIIKLMKKKIQQKISVKFLGELLDSILRWKFHITELSKKLSKTIGFFCKIMHFVPLEILKALYFSLLYSFVSDGIAVWALTYKSLLDPINVSQKKIVRIMNFKEPNSHTEPLFAQLRFLKIRDIHELQLLSFMYDCQNHLAPTHSHSYFTQVLRCMVIILC